MRINCSTISLEIFNKIVSERFFSQIWSTVIVVSKLKPDKPKVLPTSYRPISLTCVVYKVMEKMIASRLVTFLQMNNILNQILYKTVFAKDDRQLTTWRT